MKRVITVLAVLLTIGVAQATPDTRGGGGAGEIPTPSLSSNQRVELADGEVYMLVGLIQFHDQQPYFEVDLSEHPWLANVKRKAIPYYPLEASADYWRRFRNKRVRAYVEAHGEVRFSDSGSTAMYVITLLPLANPTLLD